MQASFVAEGMDLVIILDALRALANFRSINPS